MAVEHAEVTHDTLNVDVAFPRSVVFSRAKDQDAQDGVQSLEAFVAFVGLHGDAVIQDLHTRQKK